VNRAFGRADVFPFEQQARTEASSSPSVNAGWPLELAALVRPRRRWEFDTPGHPSDTSACGRDRQTPVLRRITCCPRSRRQSHSSADSTTIHSPAMSRPFSLSQSAIPPWSCLGHGRAFADSRRRIDAMSRPDGEAGVTGQRLLTAKWAAGVIEASPIDAAGVRLGLVKMSAAMR
jgi:hypothetical protein